MVVPVVLYHGAEAWSASVAFDAMLDLPDAMRTALAPYLVRFGFLLDDLSAIPDDQLRGRAMTALGSLVEACFKHARTRADLLDILSGWAEALREVVRAPHGLEALVRVMRYILLVNDHVEPEALQVFLEGVIGSDAKETIMTAGQRLIEQGVRQGHEQGVRQGLEQGVRQGLEQGVRQGIEQGERALLLRLLQKRFGREVDATIEQRVATASPEQVATWADRVLAAATLADVLAD